MRLLQWQSFVVNDRDGVFINRLWEIRRRLEMTILRTCYVAAQIRMSTSSRDIALPVLRAFTAAGDLACFFSYPERT